MPLFGFKYQFEKAVENGFDWLEGRPFRHPGVRPKVQTIRAMRKRPIQVGDRAVCAVGVRTKGYRQLGVGIVHTAISIQILPIPSKGWAPSVYLLGPRGAWRWQSPKQVADILTQDGFDYYHDFFNFFRTVHGLPFEGQLIRWGRGTSAAVAAEGE